MTRTADPTESGSNATSQTTETPVKSEYPTPEPTKTRTNYSYRVQRAANAVNRILGDHPPERRDRIIAKVLRRFLLEARLNRRWTANVSTVMLEWIAARSAPTPHSGGDVDAVRRGP